MDNHEKFEDWKRLGFVIGYMTAEFGPNWIQEYKGNEKTFNKVFDNSIHAYMNMPITDPIKELMVYMRMGAYSLKKLCEEES